MKSALFMARDMYSCRWALTSTSIPWNWATWKSETSAAMAAVAARARTAENFIDMVIIVDV